MDENEVRHIINKIKLEKYKKMKREGFYLSSADHYLDHKKIAGRRKIMQQSKLFIIGGVIAAAIGAVVAYLQN